MKKPPVDYSKNLPRRVRGKGFCVAMDDYGVRCDNPATVEETYHGVGHEKARWVVVYVCDFHGDLAVKALDGNMKNHEWHRKKRGGKLMYPRPSSF